MMKNAISFAALKQKHNSMFLLPAESKVDVAKQNFSSSFIFNHILFLFGILNAIPLFIKYWGTLNTKHASIIYFGAYCLLSIIAIICCVFIKYVFKSENHIVINIPFYYTLISVYCNVIYRILSFGNPLTGIFLITIVSLVALIFCNCHPLLFIIILIPPFCVEGLVLLRDYSVDVFADFVLFYIVLIVLAQYKRNATVKEIKSTLDLEHKKKNLEDEFSKQSAEIETQAVELIHQNRKLMKIQDETIISLSNLVENRDSDTGAHVKRTSKYVNILANAAYQKKLYSDVITDDFIDLATKAAPLHDIGKIVVPDAILKKPGKLTDEEFDEIKRHASAGGKIVKDVLGVSNDADYIQMASDIATYHHEKWNGMGYPAGLKDTNIPVSARLMAIADVYDALVSKRCYKDSMSFDEAAEIIKSSSGSHFDPQLVELFLENKTDFESIARKYKD